MNSLHNELYLKMIEKNINICHNFKMFLFCAFKSLIIGILDVTWMFCANFMAQCALLIALVQMSLINDNNQI